VKDLGLFFAILVIGGVVFLPLHIVVLRARSGAQLITSLNATIGISTITGVAAVWLLFGDQFSSPGAALVAYVGGALCFAAYAGLYGLLLPSSVDRSVSVHIVSLLALAPGRRMTEAELFEVYTHDDMLQKRFLDCVNTGIIEREGDQLVLTKKGAAIARLYTFVGAGLGMNLWYFERRRTGASAFKR
jgi:hypothetical protein